MGVETNAIFRNIELETIHHMLVSWFGSRTLLKSVPTPWLVPQIHVQKESFTPLMYPFTFR
jgi:hypothetical protein